MNIDEMHSDAASSSRQDSFVGNVESGKAPAANIKKLREEMEMTRARLSDQKFKITDYPDPLLPRGNASAKASATWVTIESEERLRQVIAKIRESSNA